MDHPKIAHCVETLCQRGCKEVSRLILALERNEPVAEADGLPAAERQAVLDELKAIMAVYDERGSCGPA